MTAQPQRLPTAVLVPPRAAALLDRAGIEAVTEWQRSVLAQAEPPVDDDDAASRDERVERARARKVARRKHEAMLERARAQLAASEADLTGPSRNAVIAHRNAWFAAKLADSLRAFGFGNVVIVENGADAIGATIAEQPDLLLVEDKLPMVTGANVVREATRYAPQTIVAASVAYTADAAALRDAGARAAFTRRVPPADVAAQLVGLLPDETALVLRQS